VRPSKIIILAAALLFAGWVFYSLMHVEPVRVLESSLQHDNGQVFVEGKVENTGRDTGPLDIEVHYYDGAGRALGQDKIVVDGLKKGVITEFHTPKRTLGQVEEFSLYVNHGRNPYGN
jgi:hypothetical protein